MSDALVYADGPASWSVELAPPLGEKIGWIEERNGRFHVAGNDDDANRTSELAGVDHGPHDSLEDAMAAIAYRLGGRCVITAASELSVTGAGRPRRFIAHA